MAEAVIRIVLDDADFVSGLHNVKAQLDKVTRGAGPGAAVSVDFKRATDSVRKFEGALKAGNNTTRQGFTAYEQLRVKLSGVTTLQSQNAITAKEADAQYKRLYSTIQNQALSAIKSLIDQFGRGQIEEKELVAETKKWSDTLAGAERKVLETQQALKAANEQKRLFARASQLSSKASLEEKLAASGLSLSLIHI